MDNSITKQTIALYWQHLRRRKVTWFIAVFLVMGGVVVGQFLQPLIAALALDKLSQNDISTLSVIDDFGMLLAILAGLLVSELILWRSGIFIFWTMEAKIMKELSQRCFNFLTHQTHSFHTNNFGGSLVSQTNKFVSAFERILDETLFSIVTIITAYIATIVILLPRAPQFVLVFVIISSIYIVVLFWRARIAQPYNVRHASTESTQTAQLADAITNVQTIKPFANEKLEDRLFEKKTHDVLNKSLGLRNIITTNEMVSNLFSGTLYFMAILFAIITVVVYDAELGTMLLIVTYTSGLLRRLWEMQETMRTLTRGFGDAHDMTIILQDEPEIKNVKNPTMLHVNKGSIEFSDISFTHENQRQNELFNNLSFKIAGGQKIGLVGHSGGGKTTISCLLLRLYDLDNGKILIDGQDIAKTTQENLRKNIAYVPQEPLLFHRGLADNIRYGKLDATDEEVIKAAELSNASEFINKLPKGYETLVGERGTKLSGGQKQRIAIARAMLKNAPILLLDEATSALDSESEKLIQDALWKLMKDKTTIVIAHRLSTIQRMDRIIVLEEGKIVEEGNHKELLAKKGVYAELWKHQSGGFLET